MSCLGKERRLQNVKALKEALQAGRGQDEFEKNRGRFWKQDLGMVTCDGWE